MMTENNVSENGKGCDWHDAAGRFQKGNPGKPRGTSKNRLRDEIKTFLNENWKNFPTWFQQLKPREKVQTMLDLLPYAVPRLQSITNVEGEDIPHEPGASVDWTRLSQSALKEVLSLTTIHNNGNEPG